MGQAFVRALATGEVVLGRLLSALGLVLGTIERALAELIALAVAVFQFIALPIASNWGSVSERLCVSLSNLPGTGEVPAGQRQCVWPSLVVPPH